jgi:hypothetical protein
MNSYINNQVIKGRGNFSSTGRRRRQVQPALPEGINIEEDNYFRLRGMARDFEYLHYYDLYIEETERYIRLLQQRQRTRDQNQIDNLNNRIAYCINRRNGFLESMENYTAHYPNSSRSSSSINSNNNSINENESENEVIPATTTNGGSIYQDYMNKKKRMVTNLIHGRKYWSPSSQNILNKYGNSIIYKIEVNKAILSKPLMQTLNFTSRNNFKNEMQKQNIKNLYHLSLYLHTDNGSFKLEKAEVVHLNKTDRKQKEQNESKIVPCKHITLQKFVDNGIEKMGINAFFIYSAKDANCQNFVLNLLHANGIHNVDTFVKQETEKLFDVPNMPQNYMRKLTNSVTDIGHKMDILQQGEGIKIGGKLYNFL